MQNYEINRQTLAILSYENEKAKIIEENDEFIVNNSTMKIIDNSCKFFGSSYEGRLAGTKRILGISHKAPIIIEESKGIIFFPTASPRLDKCSWISLNKISEYYKEKDEIIIKFTCGKTIKLKLSYSIIDNQILRANRLETLLSKKRKEFQNIY